MVSPESSVMIQKGFSHGISGDGVAGNSSIHAAHLLPQTRSYPWQSQQVLFQCLLNFSTLLLCAQRMSCLMPDTSLIQSYLGALCFPDTGQVGDHHHFSFSGPFARLNNTISHKILFFCFSFLNLCPAGPPPSQSAVLDQTCHPWRHITKAVGLIILPGSFCSYFYIPFCCLPFSQQQNTSD